ncbi:MAG: response regulator transcription factor [Negativicutes bacterium]|nr:response regulator transcription factor [Negativicutes bacterium]
MIYCVEDDLNIRELIVYTLQSTGFTAKGFADGEAFFMELQQKMPDLVILDLMLPGQDGASILKQLRSTAQTADLPVILATAKGSEYDKVSGLDAGADDYISKPFGMMELVSRVKAVLRRSGSKQKGVLLTRGALSLNSEKHQVSVKGEAIPLTLKEFLLLQQLMSNPGTVFTRDALLATIWGYDFSGETRTVDVHIRTLRQKLGECGNLIETVRGLGYRMVEQE